MLPFIKIEKKVYFGLDIGRKGLRLAEITKEKNREVTIKNLSFKNLTKDKSSSSLYTPERIVLKDLQILKELLSQYGAKGNGVVLSLSDPFFYVNLWEGENLPKDESDIINFLLWKEKERIPYPKEESRIVFKILSSEERKQKVLYGVISEILLGSLERIFLEEGWKIKGINPSSFYLYNLFSPLLKEKKNLVFIVLGDGFFTFLGFLDGDLELYRTKEIERNDDRIIPEIYATYLAFKKKNDLKDLNCLYLFSPYPDLGIEEKLRDVTGKEILSLFLKEKVNRNEKIASSLRLESFSICPTNSKTEDHNGNLNMEELGEEKEEFINPFAFAIAGAWTLCQRRSFI